MFNVRRLRGEGDSKAKEKIALAISQALDVLALHVLSNANVLALALTKPIRYRTDKLPS